VAASPDQYFPSTYVGWFFGHQHKCYIYEDTRLPYRARLIGHGSFPHDIQKEKFPDKDGSGNPLMAFAQLAYRGYPSGTCV